MLSIARIERKTSSGRKKTLWQKMEGNFKEQIQLQFNLNLKIERGRRGRIVRKKENRH